MSHDVVILYPVCHLYCEHEIHLSMNALEDARSGRVSVQGMWIDICIAFRVPLLHS